MADCGVTVDALAVVAPELAISVPSGVMGTERVAVSSIGASNALVVASEVVNLLSLVLLVFSQGTVVRSYPLLL